MYKPSDVKLSSEKVSDFIMLVPQRYAHYKVNERCPIPPAIKEQHISLSRLQTYLYIHILTSLVGPHSAPVQHLMKLGIVSHPRCRFSVLREIGSCGQERKFWDIVSSRGTLQYIS